MTNQPLHNLHAQEPIARQAEGASLYTALCPLSELQQAYVQVKEHACELSIDPLTIEAIEAEGIAPFLKLLSDDLQARSYHPSQATGCDRRTALRDTVMLAALQRILESTFPTAFSSNQDAEKTIKWVAGNIDRGLTRVHAVNFAESRDDEAYERLVERSGQRIGDPPLITLLKEILALPTPRGDAARKLLTPLLAGIAYEGIDHILQQAKALGREDHFLHLQCMRAGNELVVLSDRDPRYDWILPAVQKRLREELASLNFEPEAVETQSFDITCGEPLRFLDYELRCTQGKHGDFRVRYKLAPGAVPQQTGNVLENRSLFGRFQLVRFLQPCLKWLERWRAWRFVHRGYRKANSIQASWRHLPITLYPVVAYLFGLRSPAAWLCLALIFVCNWRRILYYVQTAWVGSEQHKFGGAYSKLRSIQVGWRHLPITLFPVLLLLFGWRSPVPWLDLALIFVCNWRLTVGFVKSHKLDVAMGGCAIAALIYLYPFLSDIYAHRPREVAASSSVPPGFFLGEYYGPSWWSGEPIPIVNYVLYLPPQLQGQKGPFPLIVFLHGYGERTKTRIFKGGLPTAIAQRFGTNKPNGHFPFVAFFPIDPTGNWQAGSAEVERVMAALDYVISRHRIDPSRVYLTGHSAGGSGVWSLAEAYPDKWAAVAPLCSFISPDVSKVKHLPAWIFHGAKDQAAPVNRERYLVRELEEAGADVHYTEIPNKGHFIWDVAYNPKDLYKWFASKKKD